MELYAGLAPNLLWKTVIPPTLNLEPVFYTYFLSDRFVPS